MLSPSSFKKNQCFVFLWSGTATVSPNWPSHEAETLAETPSVEADPYLGKLHINGTVLPGCKLWNVKSGC